MSICRPSRACSLKRIAPRTEVSASSFWGGSLPEASGGTEMATAAQATERPGTRSGRPATSARRDDRLYLRRDALVHLDRHHVGSGGADRVVELDLALVQLEAARLLDRVDDVLRGDRSEQPPVVARGLRDRQHRARQQGRVLLSAVRQILCRLLGSVHAPLRLRDRTRRGRRSELAGQEEVAQVAGGHVDDVAALTDVLHVLEKDRLGHGAYLSLTYGRSPSSRARLIATASCF